MWVLTCRSSVATQIEAAAGSRGEKANTHTHTHTHIYRHANVHDLLGRQTTAIKSKSTLYFKISAGTGTEIIS